MTTLAARRAPALSAAGLLAGLAAAVAVRVAVGGVDVAGSAIAGLAFGACLAALAAAGGMAVSRPSARGVLAGTVGAVVLCLPVALHRIGAAGHRPAGSFAGWAAVVTLVALTEEALLRGALYDALRGAASHAGPVRADVMAIGGAAVAFALLHAPVYGWHVVPLDLAVGGWLGALRAATGTLAAPATAHVVADLAGWWLR